MGKSRVLRQMKNACLRTLIFKAVAYNMSMWSNVISIDKSYKKELKYIKSELNKIRELSFAEEESKMREWIYLACACQNRDDVEQSVERMIETVFLAFLKFDYFKERIPLCNFNHAKCALLSSIVCFDNDFESGIVAKTLANSLDYNVDGIFNFRLRNLKSAWDEVAEVASRLVENSSCDNDIYDVASFIAGSDGGKNEIVVDQSGMRNVTEGKRVLPIDVFGDDEYDMLFAIIREKPKEIYLHDVEFSRPMMDCLCKIAKVVQSA